VLIMVMSLLLQHSPVYRRFAVSLLSSLCHRLNNPHIAYVIILPKKFTTVNNCFKKSDKKEYINRKTMYDTQYLCETLRAESHIVARSQKTEDRGNIRKSR